MPVPNPGDTKVGDHLALRGEKGRIGNPTNAQCPAAHFERRRDRPGDEPGKHLGRGPSTHSKQGAGRPKEKGCSLSGGPVSLDHGPLSRLPGVLNSSTSDRI